jgi:hypothetical protein
VDAVIGAAARHTPEVRLDTRGVPARGGAGPDVAARRAGSYRGGLSRRLPRAGLLLVALGCGAGGVEPEPGAVTEAVATRADTDPTVTFGYAVHGSNLHPPLYHRVEAVPCPELDDAACTIDEDCGPAHACYCQNVWSPAVCLPAECLTDADCDGPCFLSLGGVTEGPQERCPAGLFCDRPGSTCASGGDCPGNGTACVYFATTDRFECSHPECL